MEGGTLSRVIGRLKMMTATNRRHYRKTSVRLGLENKTFDLRVWFGA